MSRRAPLCPGLGLGEVRNRGPLSTSPSRRGAGGGPGLG